MEGFDTMAMPPYLASPLSLGNLQGDYLNAMPGLDMTDHRSNFDSETFVRYVRIFLLLQTPGNMRLGGLELAVSVR